MNYLIKNGNIVLEDKTLRSHIVVVGNTIKFATINPARLLGLGSNLGSIEVGKSSDRVLL